MIYPRATDLLDNIESTMVSHIEPSLSTLAGKSAAATIRHLLRHVRTRIEVEGKVLTADIRALKAVLAETRAYLAARPIAGSPDVIQRIDAAVEQEAAASDDYLGLNELAGLAGPLREALYQALKLLSASAAERGDDVDYCAIRQRIRDYMVEQVEQEDRLIAPAFFGGGPRR